MFNDLTNQLIDEYSSYENPWEGSVFERIALASCDRRGRFGEDWLHHHLSLADISNEWLEDRNINPIDGVYDVKLLGKPRARIEVKTSFHPQYKFQHENLKVAELCDWYIFIDVAYDSITLVILTHEFFLNEFNADTNQLGIIPHLRKDTTDNHKYDFSGLQHRRAEELGLALDITCDTPESDIISFLQTHFSLWTY